MSSFTKELKFIGIPDSFIEKIINHFAGSQVYVPMPSTNGKKNRNVEICKNFNGRNYRELCAKHNLSYQHLYKIIKKELAKNKREKCASFSNTG